MNAKELLLILFLTVPGLAISAELEKLVDAVDTEH